MSRSDVEIKNPAKAFLKWNGSEGGFSYFDKTKGKKGENVKVKMPITFMVLDTLATIKGFDANTSSGFWSNEIHSNEISTGILTVKNKTGVCAQGVYADVIKHKNCTGAKYCQSVYAAVAIGENTEIVNFQLTGTSLSAWIDFGKTNKVYKGGVTVAKMTEGKKGITKYKTPVFEMVEVSKEAETKAIELDGILKDYLKAYFSKTQEQETTTEQA